MGPGDWLCKHVKVGAIACQAARGSQQYGAISASRGFSRRDGEGREGTLSNASSTKQVGKDIRRVREEVRGEVECSGKEVAWAVPAVQVVVG